MASGAGIDVQRLMGLDVGTRTIGVAVSDLLGLTAQPLVVLRRTSMQNDLAELHRLAHGEGIAAFVVGLPRRTSGMEGPEAANVRIFAAELQKTLGLPVHFMDERFTTAVAQSAMLAANVRRDKRRAVVDKLAAALILQSYLDRQANTSTGDSS